VRAGLDPSHIDLVVPLVMVGAGLGTRLLAMCDPADRELAGTLLTAPARSRVFGLLFGGCVTLLAYARVGRLPFGRLVDVLAIPAALFLAIVRLGCLLGGCCWGDVAVPPGAHALVEGDLLRQVETVPWLSGRWAPSIRFAAGSFAHAQHVALGLVPADAPSLPVHPVQVYEAALLVLLIWAVGRREPGWRGSPGRAASAMVLGYTALRFVTEFLRADNRLVLSVLTMPQMMCLLVAAGVGVASMRGRQRGQGERLGTPAPPNPAWSVGTAGQ
jgi:phosphatidylglycerol:prolipoprotein diacylglycerol transferase